MAEIVSAYNAAAGGPSFLREASGREPVVSCPPLPRPPVRLSVACAPYVRFASKYIMERWSECTPHVPVARAAVLRRKCDAVLAVFANDLMASMQVCGCMENTMYKSTILSLSRAPIHCAESFVLPD